MANALNDLPAGYRLELNTPPPSDVRADLARDINAFHSLTVPHDTRRFGLIVRDGRDAIAAGLIGVLSWDWLFVEAVWVSEPLRGAGVGSGLMARAETYAMAAGCHSAWLDTFQARAFYVSLGYEVFGMLEEYPAVQSRWFMRKRLGRVAP